MKLYYTVLFSGYVQIYLRLFCVLLTCTYQKQANSTKKLFWDSLLFFVGCGEDAECQALPQTLIIMRLFFTAMCTNLTSPHNFLVDLFIIPFFRKIPSSQKTHCNEKINYVQYIQGGMVYGTKKVQ